MENKNICPICNRSYGGYPALSRKDNKTPICSECGIKEALEDYYGFSNYGIHKVKEKENEDTD